MVTLPHDIDKHILPVVEILNHYGFKTFESCQGGNDHCFDKPTIRFEGNELDLIRACEICELEGYIVEDARRVYRKTPVYRDDNTPLVKMIGKVWETPFNEITFLLATSS